MSGFNLTKQFRDDINKLKDKYTPTNGCDNCWGDLHQGCTEKCRNEFKLSREFDKDIVDLITKVANGVNSRPANCAIFDVSKSYCGEQGEENMKDDIKEIMHACGGKFDFIRLCNEAQEELDEAAFDLDQESRMNGV